MKKSNFITLMMTVVGTLLFGFGMCMTLLPEWEMMKPGIVCGAAGLIVLLAAVIYWRRKEGKQPIRVSGKALGIAALATAGSLLLGAGMSLCMAYGNMVFGVILGIVGIVVLMMLIPVTVGLKG